MNNDTNTIDLSGVDPVEFSWDSNNTTTGVIAQEIDPLYSTMASTISYPSVNTVTLNSGITITATGIASSGGYTISTPYEDLEARLEKLEKIIAEEEEVRRTHPAVQMAYDEYRLLYILAKKNPSDNLTDE